MVLPTAFREATRRSRRLADRTSLGVGGTPEFTFEPETADEASAILAACHREGVPVRLLGGGTNLLVGDDPLPGAVVSTRRLRDLRRDTQRVTVGAGRSFSGLVRRAAAWQVPVLSGCPGIPGSVGGAVAMNAGGRFGTVSEALLEVGGLDARGRPFERRVRESEFGYRESPFEGELVTHAVFRRDTALDPAVEGARWAEALAHKRATQPLGARSAGCAFRNPTVGGTRLSAGRLVDDAGLKGRSVGGASVSDVHANFVVNGGTATARDVQTLIALVQRTVRKTTGVTLELEVRVWG